MNALIQTIANYLQHAAFTAPFFDAWLKSLAVLAVAAGVCLLLAASRRGDPALDLVSGGGRPAMFAVALLPAALVAQTALVGLHRF